MRPPHRVDSSWTGIGPDRCRVPCVSARVNFLPKLVPVMNQKSPAPRSRGSLRNGINNGKVLIIICHTASHRCHCSRWCCGREKKNTKVERGGENVSSFHGLAVTLRNLTSRNGFRGRGEKEQTFCHVSVMIWLWLLPKWAGRCVGN